MQAPKEFWGTFCKVVFEGQPTLSEQICCYILSKGKKRGFYCNKPGAHNGQMPACSKHMHKYGQEDDIFQVRYYSPMDGSESIIPVIDRIPRIYASTPIIPRTPADVFPPTM